MFVRGGYVRPGYYLNVAGDVGYYWSPVGRNSSNAYGLAFDSGVGPSGYYYRYNGQSIRCVALGG